MSYKSYDQSYVPKDGDEHIRDHPFTRVSGPNWADLCQGEPERWRPGAWLTVMVAPDDATFGAHGLGSVKFDVVKVVPLPGRLKTRVFYYRTFIDPAGKPYRRSSLLVSGIGKFRKTVSHFGHDYEVHPDHPVMEMSQ